ncbi:hypothetical protein [Olivibacter domesticus]|uniref:Cytochrome P460 n=1 Tax=Olivibacter domesticus TaxID=407022 RepID=A0A1H7UDB5_OLID1|nr:hypothetical protein [Olivibacter domesticus]SEL94993.1 hypothetical protein SAMN05661044_03842 [Olivibacter domesticus]
MKHNLYITLTIAVLSLFGCNPKNGLGLNENASLNSFGDLPENPLLLNAITTSILQKDGSMTILYGNDLAYNHAKMSSKGNYPTGSVLYGVIWKLQEDEQWFGANIPENIRKIERIEFLDDNKTDYASFNLKGIEDINPDGAKERIDQIKGMKMAITP